jgi:hypothetical protein
MGEIQRLRLRRFSLLFRSFSLNSCGYSPQTIEKPGQICIASHAGFLPSRLLATPDLTAVRQAA